MILIIKTQTKRVKIQKTHFNHIFYKNYLKNHILNKKKSTNMNI